VRRALALEDRAICERTERRVEDAVGRVRAADVLRDEAEERERVADGLLERRRVRAGRSRYVAGSVPVSLASASNV